jgi:hypothetical protein
VPLVPVPSPVPGKGRVRRAEIIAAIPIPRHYSYSYFLWTMLSLAYLFTRVVFLLCLLKSILKYFKNNGDGEGEPVNRSSFAVRALAGIPFVEDAEPKAAMGLAPRAPRYHME